MINDIEEEDSAGYINGFAKVPFPYPRSTPVLLVPLLVMTKSSQLSWLKSPTPIEYGEAGSME